MLEQPPAAAPAAPALPVMMFDEMTSAPAPASRRGVPAVPALAVESLRSRTRKRRLILGGVGTVVVLMAANTVIGLVNRAPSTSDLVAAVSAQIPGDGSLAAATSTGEQFLRAYLSSANTPAAVLQRKEILDSLSHGEGSAWVASTPSETGTTQSIVSGPSLIFPPVPSETLPGVVTATYQVWLADPSGARTRLTVSVPVALDDKSRAIVAAPPSIIPTGDAKTPDLPEVPNDSETATAVRPNLEQFLKAWAAGGPDAAPEVTTQLNAFLAPDATFYTSRGLGGLVTFDAISDLKLAPPAPGSPLADGQVTVVWKRPTGETYQQTYALSVEQAAGKWLIHRIGSL
jgi:hypothetical protein